MGPGAGEGLPQSELEDAWGLEECTRCSAATDGDVVEGAAAELDEAIVAWGAVGVVSTRPALAAVGATAEATAEPE